MKHASFAVIVAWVLLTLAWTSTGTALGALVPYNTYLAGDLSDTHSVLDGKDGVDGHPDALFSEPAGFIFWDYGPDIPSGTQVWIIAAGDKQVVGAYTMNTDGVYTFAGGGGIYGDKPSTGGVDEGATTGEGLIVLVEMGSDYYIGSFVSAPLNSGYADTTPGGDNIEVTTQTVPVPEPATLALLLAGGVAMFSVARRRSSRR